MNEETISALISENARLGAELKRTQELLKIVSGEHDNQMREEGAKAERERVLTEITSLVMLKHTRHGCINVGELCDMIESLRSSSPGA